MTIKRLLPLACTERSRSIREGGFIADKRGRRKGLKARALGEKHTPCLRQAGPSCRPGKLTSRKNPPLAPPKRGIWSVPRFQSLASVGELLDKILLHFVMLKRLPAGRHFVSRTGLVHTVYFSIQSSFVGSLEVTALNIEL